MRKRYNIGDLVHIPQAVQLIAHQPSRGPSQQLTIPLGVRETKNPTVAVVTGISKTGEYIDVLCDGNVWSVRDIAVYALNGVAAK